MTHLFFTDPHLGLSRSSHTTAQSQKALQDTLLEHARAALEAGKILGAHVHCLGDLFDRYSNPEHIIAQGEEVVTGCTSVLAGNHDVRNRADVVGSLQLLAILAEGQRAKPTIFFSPFGEVRVFDQGFDDCWIVGVPHMGGQDLFDTALSEAGNRVFHVKHVPKILLLHCNYNRDFGHAGDNDPTLNLSRERAEGLLSLFDYILIGHEHEPSEDFGGRLKVLGNTMPLGFGEIADRFLYVFKDGEFSRVPLWSVAGNFFSTTADRVLAGELERLPVASPRMVEITGKLEARDYPEFAKAVARLWKTQDGLLMVRNNTELVRPDAPKIGAVEARSVSIPELIAADLKDSALLAEYEQLVAEEEPKDAE